MKSIIVRYLFLTIASGGVAVLLMLSLYWYLLLVDYLVDHHGWSRGMLGLIPFVLFTGMLSMDCYRSLRRP